jgi:hypothetical protein
LILYFVYAKKPQNIEQQEPTFTQSATAQLSEEIKPTIPREIKTKNQGACRNWIHKS